MKTDERKTGEPLFEHFETIQLTKPAFKNWVINAQLVQNDYMVFYSSFALTLTDNDFYSSFALTLTDTARVLSLYLSFSQNPKPKTSL